MLGGLALFIHLGQWQHGKADRKRAAQTLLDGRSHSAPIALPTSPIADVEPLRYAPVALRGSYDAAHQFLVDNRVHNDVAGYHVITPLRLAGSNMHVLVNRGWIAAPANHSELPSIDTPTQEVELTGTAAIPPSRFFTLGTAPASTTWQPVWQNLDMARFSATAPYPVQPVVIELDAAAPTGFARDWPRPDERWERHLSYAFQWYGFAASAVLIWLYMGWRRAAPSSEASPKCPARKSNCC